MSVWYFWVVVNATHIIFVTVSALRRALTYQSKREEGEAISGLGKRTTILHYREIIEQRRAMRKRLDGCKLLYLSTFHTSSWSLNILSAFLMDPGGSLYNHCSNVKEKYTLRTNSVCTVEACHKGQFGTRPFVPLCPSYFCIWIQHLSG